jgi:hypothetical protein
MRDMPMAGLWYSSFHAILHSMSFARSRVGQFEYTHTVSTHTERRPEPEDTDGRMSHATCAHGADCD